MFISYVGRHFIVSVTHLALPNALTATEGIKGVRYEWRFVKPNFAQFNAGKSHSWAKIEHRLLGSS